MINKVQKPLGILAGISLLGGCVFLAAQGSRPNVGATTNSATQEEVLRYIRERFGIPDAVKLTMGPFRDSADPDFYEATITADDGKKPQLQNISVSKNGRYLAMNSMVALGADPKADIEHYVRQISKLPDKTQLTVGMFRNSALSNFFETTITADYGTRKQTQNVYVTKDSRFLVLGNVFTLIPNLRREVLHSIVTRNQPSIGPANAPVTIVEYADLQCPQCARMHEFLENEVLPKYGDKIRVVFKDFPLVQVHDWAMTAAIASQCAYQLNPSAFFPYRSLIFRHQSGINATNAREMLIEYGAEEGIDRLELGACIDAKRTLPPVEAALREGKAVNVASTPTSFVNGKMVVGTPPPETFYSLIDEAARGPK